MKRRRTPETINAHPNVTPLIDVVMVMIVFFMLVAKIGVNTGADPGIVVPPSFQGIDISDFGNTLVLNVQAGQLEQPRVTALVGNTVEEVKVFDPVTAQKPLTSTLRRFRYGMDMKQGGSGKDADNSEFSVIVRADENLDYRYIEPVLIACAESVVKDVKFNTSKVYQAVAEGGGQ